MARVPSDLHLAPSVLDRLLDDDPRGGAIELYSDDLRNPVALAVKFREGGDPLSRHIFEQFSEETQQELANYDESTPMPDTLQQSIVVGLNLLMKRAPLYESRRFKHIKLSKDTLRVIDQIPPGTVSLSLNRTLLEEAYPEELWKRRSEMPTYTLTQLKNDVSRDLANLLNTRQELEDELPLEFKEVRTSLLAYGLPDFTAFSLTNTADRKRIRRGVEQAIAAFEPRLKSVRVTLDPPQKFDQVLRFRIEALMRVDPAPEPVTFDAVLQMTTQEYSVRG